MPCLRIDNLFNIKIRKQMINMRLTNLKAMRKSSLTSGAIDKLIELHISWCVKIRYYKLRTRLQHRVGSNIVLPYECSWSTIVLPLEWKLGFEFKGATGVIHVYIGMSKDLFRKIILREKPSRAGPSCKNPKKERKKERKRS